MVNDSFGLFKRPKKLKIATDPILRQMHLINRERIWMKSSDHFRVPRPFYRLKTKSTLSGPHFATIAKFQWFSKAPSPLNGMVRVKPLGSMVFRWFWCQATIGFNGFQWLSSIDPTMEWLHTIVEVYLEVIWTFSLRASWNGCILKQNKILWSVKLTTKNIYFYKATTKTILILVDTGYGTYIQHISGPPCILQM